MECVYFQQLMGESSVSDDSMPTAVIAKMFAEIQASIKKLAEATSKLASQQPLVDDDNQKYTVSVVVDFVAVAHHTRAVTLFMWLTSTNFLDYYEVKLTLLD